MWGTRRKEHQDKVRLTKTDLENGNIERATERMNTGEGGLAKHSAVCPRPIKWENAKIVGRERNSTKRKFLEGIVTLKEKSKGIIPPERLRPNGTLATHSLCFLEQLIEKIILLSLLRSWFNSRSRS